MRSLPRSGLAAGALAAACAWGASPAAAQISFVGPVLFPAGGDASSIVVGSWNGDRLPDAATANNSSANASVLIGDGTGTFGAPAVHPIPGSPSDIAAGNFDGDRGQDLAVATQDVSGVSVLFGDNSGTFAAPTSVDLGGQAPFQVAVDDLNGDRLADLVATTSAPGGPNVFVKPGAGGGTFGPSATYAVSGPPMDVALADFNGDSVPDIVTVDGDSQMVSILLNDGTGGFGAARSFPIPNRPWSVAVGDFNEDAFLDVAVGMMLGTATVLTGDGTGGLGPAQAVAASRSPAPLGLVAGDYDSDGKLDLAALFGGMTTLRGDGAGGFGPPVDQPSPGAQSGVARDLDDDSLPDILVGANNSVAVMPNTSTPPIPGPGPLPAPVVARTANVTPVKGTVLVKQPGRRRFVQLDEATQIRIGSELDVTKGSVRMTSAAGGGKTQTGVFRGGLFKLGQNKGTRPITELKLTAKLRCVKSRRPVRTSAKGRRSRQLFGNARGRFRTRGRHSTATIRGTKWLVKDTCRSTLTVSQQGTVVVRDLVKRRTKVLKTGQRYLARRGNR